jgi:diguanylate cyclase (GGDEF)-like protein
LKTLNTYYEDYLSLREFVNDNWDTLFADNCAVLVQAFCGICEPQFIKELWRQVLELVPHAQLIGATTSGEIMSGKVSGLKNVLAFSIFSQSNVNTAFFQKQGRNDYELGRAIATKLNSEKAKVLILFATAHGVNANQLLSGVQSVNPDLPVAGGYAGDNFGASESFVFGEGDVTNCGIVGALIEGEHIIVNRHWHLGWEPLGKEMTVTEADDLRVYTIDHIPAYQIYRKYLRLEKDTKLFDVMLFPLITYKNDILMASVPLVHYEDDSLGFNTKIAVGNKVRLSFGHIDMIVERIHELLQKIGSQPAQGIFVYSCLCRRGFLNEFAQLETYPLQEIAPTAGFFTNGEFFYSHKENQVLNATMTTLLLSEPDDNEGKTKIKTGLDLCPESPGDEISQNNYLTNRSIQVLRALTSLVNTVTGELAERTAELERANESLQYIGLHDSLTGLYNRAFFEQKMKDFNSVVGTSVAIIICDVDGLKLVNDAIGHHMGDAILKGSADILRSLFDTGDVVARIGGDEFSILLQGASLNSIENYRVKIDVAVRRYNETSPVVPLSVSFGYSFREKGPIDTNILFREADNNMYREKLHHRQSVHSNLVQTLMKALGTRDMITEEHCLRLQDLVEPLATVIGCSQSSIADLRLLARFHDIGKVGIPDHILFKPGKLNAEESKEMRRHCEIGYRIVQSSPDLLPIAEWILKHHEWWNGQGYPLGVKEEAIPLECRIIAIVDAYDAMTNDRPYRKAMSNKAALEEIRRYAGFQFDPKLVAQFIAMIESRAFRN